jgi:peptide/nickel transport system permease protein
MMENIDNPKVASQEMEFIKRLEKQKLKLFIEYNVVSFALGATLVMSLIFALNTYSFFSKSVNIYFVAVTLIYLLSAAVLQILRSKIRNDIITKDEISRSSRLLGILVLPFVLVGNFFAFAAAGIILKKDPPIEHQVSVYMILTDVFVILISLLNLFKEFVAHTFVVSVMALIFILVIHIVVTILIGRNLTRDSINRKLIYLTPVLIVSTITGNLFALLLAVLIYKRCRQQNMDVSIKLIDITRRIFKNQMSATGVFIVVFLVMLSVCSLFTFEEAVILDNDYSAILLSPRLRYPFGTDEFGRCVFSRIIYGARISLMIGVAAITYPMILGGTLGAVSGYYGGRLDNVIMRVIDVIYAIPGVLLSMVIIASFGATIPNLVIALGVGSIASYARITRATVMNLANAEFVEAAKACGANDRVIILKHILLNSMAPIIVNATIGIGGIVLATSALSYLGIGIPSYIPEWGNVLRSGSTYLETQPHLAVFPGLAIMTLVLAFNFFGDGVRDALDPKLK